eukprot:COSAG02_NODE_1209_length_13869_cov_5.683660_5_plen_75_part_00
MLMRRLQAAPARGGGSRGAAADRRHFNLAGGGQHRSRHPAPPPHIMVDDATGARLLMLWRARSSCGRGVETTEG